VTGQLVTAATVRTSFLEPGMDARALNIEQARLLENETPGLDSLAEVLDVARPLLPPGLGSVLVSVATRLDTSNEVEGRMEQAIAGAADGLTRTLRGLELAGNGSPFVARAIARRLREPLATVADPAAAGARELVEAGRIIGEVLGSVPATQVFTATVAHELGEEKYRALCELSERKVVVA
jgi:hypothetical protein